MDIAVEVIANNAESGCFGGRDEWCPLLKQNIGVVHNEWLFGKGRLSRAPVRDGAFLPYRG